MAKKLLIIDDDSNIREIISNTFKAHDFEIFQAAESQSGLALIREMRPNIALVDIQMPGMSGIEALKEIKLIDSAIIVIIMTGCDTTSNAIDAMRYGAFDYITKPFDMMKLKELVDKALISSRLSRKVRISSKNTGFDEPAPDEDLMLGSSPEMVEIWKMVGKVADSDETVLVFGESGTGKDLLARAIVNNSKRKDKPFLAINCAALPENLLESELFGHEKGAFTDAHTRKIGKFEQCHGGTLFLDEISELSQLSQSKLLRVLENQSFMRVGGNSEIKVDVRIIAATNRNMVHEVKEGAFRLDLFYRLRIISIFLPPLRERISDIPLLTNLFIKKSAGKSGKKIYGITPEALQFLTTYNWQGNIRELKNAISSAVVFTKSETLQLEDFSHLLSQDSQQQPISNDCMIQLNDLLRSRFPEICQMQAGTVYQYFKEGIEGPLVNLAMEHCQNSQVAAAKLLGISRNTLRKILERQVNVEPKAS